MKYPCKTCLVKPACSQECDLYNVFMKNLADLWAPLTVLFSCMIVLVTLFAVLIHYETDTEDFLLTYMKLLWWSSMATLLVLDWKRFFDNIFSSVLLAPIVLPSMIVWKIQAKLYKRF